MSAAPVGLRARAQIAPFALDRPSDVAAAAAALAQTGRTALMAGGVDLIDRLKGAAPLDRLVALAGIADLRAIAMEGDTLSIGAAVTHGALIASPVIAANLPDLAAIWRNIANPRVRAIGTIGGNLMAGQRHYDAAPALLALGADARVMTPDGATHDVPLLDVLARTDLVLLALRVPNAARKTLAAERSLHPMVSVYGATSRNDGPMRLAFGCAYDRPVVIALRAGAAAADIAVALATLPLPIDDDLASGVYRRRMLGRACMSARRDTLMDALAIDLTVNGTRRTFAVAPNLVLADLLRDTCRLAGCKIGCDQAACGACTVLVDGRPVAACATFAFAVDGCAITTVEGLGTHDALHPVQEAFLDSRAFQCGFCTSGMIMSVTALLAEHPRPDRETIRDWLGGNICRCTGYAAILAAVEAAAERLA